MIWNLPERQETWVQTLDWEDPLEKGTATHCPGYSGLENSMESQTQLSDFSLNFNTVFFRYINSLPLHTNNMR